MSILEEIRDRETWETFYQYKEASRHTKKKELNALRSFIDEESFLYDLNIGISRKWVK